MLLEICVSDSFGAGYEFCKSTPTAFEYAYHPKHVGLRLGQYTDDGQMSLAIAEAMLAHDEPSMLDYAESFCDTFWRDKRDGYARGFQNFLENTRSGIDFIHKIKPHSDRSGSAMRAVPLGLYPTVDKVVQQARLQAVLTHNTDGGIHAACAVALSAHYLYHNLGPKAKLGKWLVEVIHVNMWEGAYEDHHSKKPGNNGIECAHAAISIVQRNDLFSSAIMQAVQMGGDTDTVASITGGLCSLSREISQDVPETLLAGLEDLAYGRTYLEQIDAKLFTKFPRNPSVGQLPHPQGVGFPRQKEYD